MSRNLEKYGDATGQISLTALRNSERLYIILIVLNKNPNGHNEGGRNEKKAVYECNAANVYLDPHSYFGHYP